MNGVKPVINLLGADYYLMKDSDSYVRVRFLVAASVIIVITALSVASIWYAIDLLFHETIVEVGLSPFFALLFGCIYIFLINTFAKEEHPGNSTYLTASNMIRIAFVIFMGVLVAVPLAILAAGNSLEEKTQEYKALVLKNHTLQIRGYYRADLQDLANRRAYCLSQKQIYGTTNYDRDIVRIAAEQGVITKKINALIGEATGEIDRSNFFLYRMKLALHRPFSWVICMFIVVVFVLPGYLVFAIPSDNVYYQLKKDKERRMIQNSYQSFTHQYLNIFKEKYKVEIEIFSRFEDPPFKQIRKLETELGTMETFSAKYITGTVQNGL